MVENVSDGAWSYEKFYEGKTTEELSGLMKNRFGNFDGLTVLFWSRSGFVLILSLMFLAIASLASISWLVILTSVVGVLSFIVFAILSLILLSEYRNHRDKFKILKRVYEGRKS